MGVLLLKKRTPAPLKTGRQSKKTRGSQSETSREPASAVLGDVARDVAVWDADVAVGVLTWQRGADVAAGGLMTWQWLGCHVAPRILIL